MGRAAVHADLKVADEVWLVTALLHREHPDQVDFRVEEIVERARRARLTSRLRPGVYVHAIQHCVATRPPNPGRYRMLVETAEGRRRLYRPGDPYHPAREGAKTVPEPSQLPPECRELVAWYRTTYAPAAGAEPGEDPLMTLRASGQALWADERPDDYVRRLREGWA